MRTLKNKKRKEELLELSLKRTEYNGGRMYGIIKSGDIDKIIDKINDEITPAMKSSFCRKGYLTANEQFLDVLSNFIYYVDSNLNPLTHKDLHIRNMLNYFVPEFLICKKYWGDNNFIPYFQHNMKYTMVFNMYENIKFIYDSFDVKMWNKLKITKAMDLNNEDDLNILFRFLQIMVWSNADDFSVLYLFEHYAILLKSLPSKKRTKAGILEHIGRIHMQYVTQFEMLFRDYFKKRKLIEKLLN